MPIPLLLLLGLSGALAAPTEPPAASPFLEGLDDFLAAFDGFALPGDPVAEVTSSADPNGAPEPPPEPQEVEIVTEEALCLGCVQEIETVSAELQRVAQLAAELLEDQLNMTQVTEVTQVYRAARQVVNGIKYFLTLELLPTNCSRPREEADVCLAETEAGTLLYMVEILEHPQQELGAELLLVNEVSPEEVTDLPGLFNELELPPPSPEGVADLPGLLADPEMPPPSPVVTEEPAPAAVIEPEPAGTEADPAGTEADPAGTEGDPAGTEGDPAETEADPAGTEADLTAMISDMERLAELGALV